MGRAGDVGRRGAREGGKEGRYGGFGMVWQQEAMDGWVSMWRVGLGPM